jgi:predicted DsbA family dithiol-disulfide isomerase
VPIEVRYFTDPACPVSWGIEPNVRRLAWEFGDSLHWRFVMGGLGRDYKGHEAGAMAVWTEEAGTTDMPMDPLLWKEGAISSSYPACMAVKAAGEQGVDAQARYLRAAREGLMCLRRKLDALEPLVEEARRIRLDVERFRIDAGSHATIEAFGADLELTRDVPPGSPRTDRVPFPTLCFGEHGWVFEAAPYDDYVAAAEAAGARRVNTEPMTVDEAFKRHDRLAVPEIEALCGLPGPRAHAELWRMASEWQLKPLRSLTGWLFEAV